MNCWLYLYSNLNNMDNKLKRSSEPTIEWFKEIDLEEFSKYPKWLVGFSDITALHSLLQDRLGCESIHAGMPYTFKNHSYREDKR